MPRVLLSPECGPKCMIHLLHPCPSFMIKAAPETLMHKAVWASVLVAQQDPLCVEEGYGQKSVVERCIWP